jgi:hypothetical protein
MLTKMTLSIPNTISKMIKTIRLIILSDVNKWFMRIALSDKDKCSKGKDEEV